MTEKILIVFNLGLMIALAIVSFQLYTLKQNQGYFAQVPAEKIHTMRVWEDGSFEIVYQDEGLGETSEIGCLPEGLCND